MKKRFATVLLLIPFFFGYTQELIPLENPSLEGAPRQGTVPEGWFNCGPEGESPPDIQPGAGFGVVKVPMDGEAYLGMVVRDNNTWEAIGQRLVRPMLAGQCYKLGMHLCRSGTYFSKSRATNLAANFATPVYLRIWGGMEPCQRKQLLATTEPISNLAWQYYELILKPRDNYDFILIEGHYVPGQEPGIYNGNVLIDHLSALQPSGCAEEDNLGHPVVEPAGSPAGERENIPVVEAELPMEEGLAGYIAEQGRNAGFVASGIDFYQFYFIDGISPNRELRFGNAHLYRLAHALKAYPQYQVLVAVGGDREFSIVSRMETIEETFREVGLPANQYHIRRYRCSDRKKDWLWEPNEHGFLIRLEK